MLLSFVYYINNLLPLSISVEDSVTRFVVFLYFINMNLSMSYLFSVYLTTLLVAQTAPSGLRTVLGEYNIIIIKFNALLVTIYFYFNFFYT
jgi:hypothetical protein